MPYSRLTGEIHRPDDISDQQIAWARLWGTRALVVDNELRIALESIVDNYLPTGVQASAIGYLLGDDAVVCPPRLLVRRRSPPLPQLWPPAPGVVIIRPS